LAFLIFIDAAFMNAEKLIYKVTLGDAVSYESFSKQPNANGFDVESEKESITLSRALGQLTWHRRGFDDVNQAMDILAKREGDKITVDGTYKNKPIKKEYPIDGRFWSQCVHFSLMPFAQSGKKTCSFWTLSIHDMNMYEMVAENIGEEQVAALGKTIPAIHVRMQAAGVAGPFWHGDYWFRKTDFTYLRYESIEGPPGALLTVKELVEEKDN
jgi:hypothetical protein